MKFEKYQHVERLGTSEVEGIECGECWVFPKLDGANASVWMDDSGVIKVASRNHTIGDYATLRNIKEYIEKHEGINRMLKDFPTLRLFGEWLIPHTITNYRPDAWKRFYVFDIMDDQGRYYGYKYLEQAMEHYGIDYVPALACILNPTPEQLLGLLERATFLMKDGAGPGEGLVIKNYGFKNKHGRVTWAKIVRNQFKEANQMTFKVKQSLGAETVEYNISKSPVLLDIANKVMANIDNDTGWSSRMIPRLLSTTWHDFVAEECWTWLKKYSNPTINFRVLQKQVELRVKSFFPSIFGDTQCPQKVQPEAPQSEELLVKSSS